MFSDMFKKVLKVQAIAPRGKFLYSDSYTDTHLL